MGYGTDIETLAKYMVRRSGLSQDPSVDLLQYLALAYAAALALAERGADFSHKGRPLVLPEIERAYRDAMHLRSKLPSAGLDVSFISKFGRVQRESET